MSKKVAYSPDYLLNQLLNVRFQVLASDPGSPVEGQFWYNSTTKVFKYYDGSSVIVPGVGGGETNTASNVGTGGVGIFKQKTGVNLEFKKLNAGSNKISITDDTGNSEVDIDVNQANLTLTTSQLSDFASAVATLIQATRLDQLTAPNTTVSFNSQKISNLADPTNPQDAATKAYADALKQGLDIKDSVRVASTANVTVSNPGTASFDGVTLSNGDRILLKNQSTASQNGLYTFNGSGSAMTRTSDADTSAKVTSGLYVFVSEGTTNGSSGWVLTTADPITLGTTSLTFTQFSGAGQITAGDGLTKSANTLAVGAGTGVVVGPDTVGLDTASGYGTRKLAFNVGDGSSTTIDITHNLGTRDVVATVYENGTNYDDIGLEIRRPDTNTVRLIFTGITPTTNQFRCVVVG